MIEPRFNTAWLDAIFVKRREFSLAFLLGLSGCLRAVQPQSTSTTTQSTTSTQPEEQTTTLAPANPSGFQRVWSENGATGLTAYRNETLFWASPDGAVTASAPDGSDRWSRNLAGRNYKGVFLGSEQLYVPTQTGTIHAFNPETGDELWTTSLPDGGDGRSIPVSFGSQIVVNSQDPSQEVAINKETGEVRWTKLNGGMGIQHRLPIPGGAAPDEDLFVDVTTNKVTALGSEGSIVGSDRSIRPTTPPTFDEEYVYVGGEAAFGKLRTRDLSPIWTTETLSKCISKPVVTDKYVIFTSLKNGLFAFDKASESEIWHADLGQMRWSPVLYRGVLYTGTADGTCYAIDPESGDSIVSRKIGVANTTLPSIGDNALHYVGGSTAADIIRTNLTF